MNVLNLVTAVVLMIFSTSNFAINNDLRSAYKKPGREKISLTKEFTVTGSLAWKEASRKGYKFYQNKHLSGSLSGANLVGGVYFESNSNKKSGMSQIIGATFMRVGGCVTNETKPQSSTSCWNHFHLFEGKKLNQYWRIKGMKISGVSSWLKRINRNTDDAYVKIKVLKPATREFVKASLIEITLVGPRDGDWQDAFNQKWKP